MTAPFKRIDAVVTLHTAHGRFTLTIENSPGPQAPELLGEYLATAVQRQYDEVRAVPAPKPPRVEELDALRAEVIDLNRKLASQSPQPYSSIDASSPAVGAPTSAVSSYPASPSANWPRTA